MRRVWVYKNTAEGVVVQEVSGEITAANHDHILWNDRVYQDAGDSRFASREQHREYMRQNNLTIDSDYKQSWVKKQHERAEFYRSAPDSSRKQDVVNAFLNPKSGISRKSLIPED